METLDFPNFFRNKKFYNNLPLTNQLPPTVLTRRVVSWFSLSTVVYCFYELIKAGLMRWHLEHDKETTTKSDYNCLFDVVLRVNLIAFLTSELLQLPVTEWLIYKHHFWVISIISKFLTILFTQNFTLI